MRAGLGYLFDRALASAPEKVAVIQGEHSLTYEALDRRANRIARALQGVGVGRGASVALLFDNDYRFLECYFGTLRAGGVVVPVNHRLSQESVSYILRHSDARVFICSAGQTDRAALCSREAPDLKCIVALDPEGPGMLSLDDWMAAQPETEPEVRISAEDIAIQAYTAGSTGKSKGCLLTHGGQLWNLESVLSMLGLTPEDRAVVAAPLGHKNATMSIKRLLRVGGSAVILRAFTPEAYLAAIHRHGVTCTTGVPAMYQMLVARKELFSRFDTQSVRICFASSAQVPYGLQETIRTYFPNARMQEIYGATEAGYLVQPPDGSPGLVPVPGAEVRIVREDGSECQADEVGEILFRNPGVARGYHKNPEITAERLRDGWYHTGDLVRRTARGRYVVLGRKDDMIITGGENVYPKEIEDVLGRHPRVAAACVVPVRHPVKGQVPVAFVVLRERQGATEAELKEFFLARGAAYAHPRRVLFVEEFPLSAPGKIDRKLLRAQAESVVAGRGAR